VHGRGMIEETLVLSPTPQSLISEGIGELAPRLLLDGGGGAKLAAIIHRAASSSILRTLGRSSRPGCNAIGQW
jgi:hypothetical protein